MLLHSATVRYVLALDNMYTIISRDIALNSSSYRLQYRISCDHRSSFGDRVNSICITADLKQIVILCMYISEEVIVILETFKEQLVYKMIITADEK